MLLLGLFPPQGKEIDEGSLCLWRRGSRKGLVTSGFRMLLLLAGPGNTTCRRWGHCFWATNGESSEVRGGSSWWCAAGRGDCGKRRGEMAAPEGDGQMIKLAQAAGKRSSGEDCERNRWWKWGCQ
jgi:hypothetical protein